MGSNILIGNYIMNSKNIYELSLAIAVNAHSGQYDKLGFAYIDHPLRVMNLLDTDSYLLKSIALLHDFYEDCKFDEYDLSDFPSIFFDILKLLTHDKNTPYKDYIKKISKSTIATKVKIADLMDNTDPKRLDAIYKEDPETALRLAKKYAWALWYLSSIQKRRNG